LEQWWLWRGCARIELLMRLFAGAEPLRGMALPCDRHDFAKISAKMSEVSELFGVGYVLEIGDFEVALRGF
jgi:hypothetical protein